MTDTTSLLRDTRRAPLESLLEPTGNAAYILAQSGSWAVEAGPVADARFRQAAVEVLQQALVGFDPQAGARILSAERVRVVEGVSQAAAEALVQRLGPQATGAKAVPSSALAKASPWRAGLPVLGAVGGFVAGWLILSSVIAGFGAGAAVAVVLAMLNVKRPVPVLGTAPEPPPLPYATAEALGHITSALPKLDAATSAAFRDIGRAALRLIDRLLDPDDFVSIAAGGLESPLGNGALALLTHLGGLARAVTSGRALDATALAAASAQARGLWAQIDHVREALQASPSTSASRIDELGQGLDALVTSAQALV